MRTPHFALAAGLLAGAVHAQSDFDLAKGSPAILGQGITLNVAGATPGRVIAQIVSTNTGPTPLAQLNANDTRLLGVGTELLSFLQFRLVASDGTASTTALLPNTPALQGLVGHAQAITLSPVPSPGFLVKGISNPVAAQLGAAGTVKPAPAGLTTARALGFALDVAVGPQGDFDIVYAGGGTGTLLGGVPLADTEVLSTKDLTISPGSPQGTARILHTATRLQDGRWLLVGGIDANGLVFNTCEVFDPATRTFSPTGNLLVGRGGHAATLLPDGRVLVAGGTNDFTTVTATLAGTLSDAEVYDPVAGTWSLTNGSIGRRLLGPGLSTLSDGRVMLSGGVQVGIFFGNPVSAQSVTTCEFFDPVAGTWSTAPAMNSARGQHDTTQLNLADGRLLVTGGIDVPSLLGAITAGSTRTAEIFDPSTNQWTSVDMLSARVTHSLTQLPDGRVVAAGGAQGTFQTPLAIDSTEILDPSTGTWTAGPLLGAPRAAHAGVVLNDGLLVLIGGFDATTSTTLVETLHF